VLDKIACETEGAQDLHAPKGREPGHEPIMRRETRSVTRFKNLKIPPPAVPSDSDEETINSHAKRIIARPYGSALSPTAFLGQVQRRLPLTAVNAYVGSAQVRQLEQLKEDATRFATHSRFHSACSADSDDGDMWAQPVLLRSVGQLEPAWGGGLEPDTGSSAFSRYIGAEGERPVRSATVEDCPDWPPEGVCRSLARPLRGWAGELVSASTGRTGRPD
jgi:hypothetical protein